MTDSEELTPASGSTGAPPTSEAFYRRVLDELPSPVLVVDEFGQIVYGNRAVERMGGWDLSEGLGSSVIDYIHPDDAEQMALSFFELAGSDESRSFTEAWASIQTRLVAENGQVIPVIVTGAGGLQDPDVNAIIYDLRPAHEQDILRRGLTGLAQGEPIDTILQLITDMVSLPPLGLDAAVLEPRGDGTYRVIGATDEEFGHILGNAHDPQPWNAGGTVPRRTFVSRYPGATGEDLFAAGYREFWHVSPDVTEGEDAYLLVAGGTVIQHPAGGPIDRLSRANELASVVLLRARADAMLEHSATHDRLTQLANRDGFVSKGTEALQATKSESAAMLFIDLDGFKEVNDQFGHAAGDTVLEVVASRLMSITRSVDLVARLGGDEFVILVGDSSDRPANERRVRVIADRALHELSRPVDLGNDESSTATVSASIGAAIASTPVTLDELLAAADAAMYVAKRKQGNQLYIASG